VPLLLLPSPLLGTTRRLLKRDLNKQERASDAGMKSAAMGVMPFKINDDLRAQLQTFGSGGGDAGWIEMVREMCRFSSAAMAAFVCEYLAIRLP